MEAVEAQGAAEFTEKIEATGAIRINSEFVNSSAPTSSLPKPSPRVSNLICLLVFGVLAIPVVVVVLPVYSRIKERADKAAALGVMRELGAAAATYTAENGGALPAAGLKDPDTWAAAASPENANAWYNVLPRKLGHKGVDQYASTPQAFYSKESFLFLPGAQYPNFDKKLARPFFAIAINRKLRRKDEQGEKAVNLAHITHPARTVLFLEQGLPNEPKATPIQPKYDGGPNGSAKSLVARYRGLGVVIFVDGHAEAINAKDVLEEYWKDKFPKEPGDIIWYQTPDENPNK